MFEALPLEHGADPDPDSALFGTPLQIAAEDMDGAVVTLLIKQGHELVNMTRGIYQGVQLAFPFFFFF